jgi:transposase
MVEVLERQIHAIELSLRRLARHRAGCQALMTQYGMGEISALLTLCELGDVTRLSSSRKAVRFAGLASAYTALIRPPVPGKLTRQASSTFRWALRSRAERRPPTETRPQRLHRPQRPRAHPHPRDPHDRAQDRQAQLPPPARPRTRRPRAPIRIARSRLPTAPHLR